MGQTSDTTSDTDTAPAADTGDPGDGLGDAGKRALEAERQARREAERAAREAQARLRELELANERRDVAAAKGLTDAQARFLTGTTREELEQSADELAEAFGLSHDTNNNGDAATTGLQRRPHEVLRTGAAPATEADDAARIAAQVLGRGAL